MWFYREEKEKQIASVTHKSIEMENYVFPLNLAYKRETRHLRLKLFKRFQFQSWNEKFYFPHRTASTLPGIQGAIINSFLNFEIVRFQKIKIKKNTKFRIRTYKLNKLNFLPFNQLWFSPLKLLLLSFVAMRIARHKSNIAKETWEVK